MIKTISVKVKVLQKVIPSGLIGKLMIFFIILMKGGNKTYKIELKITD